MIRIVLIAVHQQESDILEMALRQRGYAVYATQPAAGNYLQILQYRPDFVFLEVPTNYHEQIALMKLMRKNERFSETPVIAYGSTEDNTIRGDLKTAGCSHYLLRPLKLNSLFESMRIAAPQMDIDGAYQKSLRTREEQRILDLERVLDPHEPASVKIDLMVKHVGKLMSFPFVIAKILEVADDPNRGAEDLAKVITSDPSLLATILKVSNSVHFAARNKEIRSAKEAIMRLGFNEVKSIAMGLELLKLFPENDTFGFHRMDFWCYTLARSLITEKLAKHIRIHDPALAFLTGLLADFSVLLFDAFFPKTFETILGRIASENRSFDETARDTLGFHPMDFLVKLLQLWRLPSDIIEALRLQPKLFEQKEEFEPKPMRLIANCVAVSGVLARAGSMGHGCDDVLHEVPEHTLRELRLPVGVSPSFYETVDFALINFAGFFGIEKKYLPHLPENPETMPELLYIRLGKSLLDPYALFLARHHRLHTARNLEDCQAAFANKSFRLAVLRLCPGASLEEIAPLLDSVGRQQSTTGGPLALLGIHASEQAPTVGSLRNEWVHQNEDLRRFSQHLEILMV